MPILVEYLIFAVGSGLGGMFRYAVSSDPVFGLAHVGIPLDTVLVNGIGSFVAGFVASLSTRAAGPGARAFLIGFAGGVTTYSAFSLDAVQIIQHGHPLNAALYLLVSVTLYVAAAFAGFVTADYLEAP